MLSPRIAFSKTVETAHTVANPVLPTDSAIVFTHIVTLLNRRTEDERSLTVETLSDRFADVMREISHLKVVHNLLGYEVYEILDCNTPF